MSESEDILSDGEVALLRSLIEVVPTIGKFIAGLATGAPAAQRRVADILPLKSASQTVADELRAESKEDS